MMSAHVYLAPPASGKTSAVIERARHILQQEPLALVWVIVPDRLQVRALRSRLAQAGGILGVGVMTFQDFYQEILDNAGLTYPVAGGATLHPLLRDLVEQLYQDGLLHHYRAIRSKPGFLNLLGERFAELKRALVHPDRLASFAMRERPALRELALIYQAYQGRLRELGWADSEGSSWLAVEALEDNPQLMAGIRWLGVDGFIEFTPTQRRLLTLLADRLGEIMITLPGQAGFARAVYRRSRRALDELQHALSPQVHPMQGEIRLPHHLAYLERNLFAESDINGAPTPDDHENGDPAGAGLIHLLEARSPASEAREALRWIKALHLREAIPLEHTAIFTQDPDQYHRFLKEAAREFGLPIHFSWGEPLIETPAIAALVNLLELPGRDYPRRETLDAIRSPFFNLEPFGLDRQAAGILELVGLEGQVIAGLDQWQEAFQILASSSPTEPPGGEAEAGEREYQDGILAAPLLPQGEQIRPLRESFMTLITRLTPPEQLPLTRWVSWLEDLLEDLEFDDRCEREVLGALRRVLGGLALSEALTGSRDTGYRGFLGTLQGALEGSFIGQEGSPREGILAGRIVEARGIRLEAVAMVGLAEGIFPAVEREDPVIEERARAALGLDPQVGRDQLSLFHQALTRTDRYLLLTRPYLAEGGEDWQASYYWNGVAELFPQSIYRVRSEAPRPLHNAASREEALFWSVRQGEKPSKDPQLISRFEYVQHGRQVLAARLQEEMGSPYEGYPALIRDSIRARYDRQHIWSSSRLESYGSCPYQFYAAYALKLEPRQDPEPGLDPAQLGSLLHKILEGAYQSAGDPNDLESVLIALENEARKQFAAAPITYGFRPSALWRAEQDNLMQSLQETVRNLAEASVGWSPHAYERSFGRRGQPPLVINTSQGPVQIAGIIDRLDRDAHGHIRVIDYKTGSSRLSKNDLIEGQRLQLPIYAWAARDALGLGEPVEGLYWTILAAKAGSLKLSSFRHRDYRGVAGALELAGEHVERIVASVQEAAFPPRPPRGGCPSYCPASAWCWRYQSGFY